MRDDLDVMKQVRVRAGLQAIFCGGMVVALAAGVLASGQGPVPAGESQAALRPETVRFFESRVRPVLVEKCGSCHGPKLAQGGLRVDSRAFLLRGGKQGPAVVPGDLDASLLVRAVRHSTPALRMPPDTKLSPRDVEALETWIRLGAPWPGTLSQAAGAGPQGAAPGARHWAFQPVRPPRAPEGRNPVDSFVLARLKAAGLRPAPPAGRRTLIRRATFDLTGLPPTPEEVERFVNDRAPDAWEKVVDRLLASPRYGEKWGRYWLDWVRYADSNGLDENYHYAHAWRFRDYVIDAFNRDLPYNQFLQEQLAGDLLPPAADPRERYRRLTATGFYLLGPKLLANPDKVQVQADIIDEQIDVTSRAILGVTLSCARCHDHKFDPISQRDYYAVAGIFGSTRTMVSLKDRIWNERPLAPPEAVERYTAHQKALQAARDALKKAQSRKDTTEVGRLEAEIRSLEHSAPEPVPYALAVEDGTGSDARLFIRGDHNQPGETVPRGFPAVLSGGLQPRLDERRSGRLELADWIASPRNPLTARVLVNRVWQGHFGQGLVRTADNFGILGEKPSHPELLDWLAGWFTETVTSGKQYGSMGAREYGSGQRYGGVGAREYGSRNLPNAQGSTPNALPTSPRRRTSGLPSRGFNRLAGTAPKLSHSTSPNTKGSTPNAQRPTPDAHPHTAPSGANWSLKKLHRLIMLSETYQRSTRSDPKAETADPDNRLLWRMNRRRLLAEEQRDAMLAASGELDLTMGGSLLDVPNHERVTNDGSEDLAAKSYGSKRRTIYLPVVRNSLYEMLELFDFADPSAVTARRPETLASPQALFMLNHPLMLETAGRFADRLQRLAGSDAGRIEAAYRTLFSRHPSPRELRKAEAFLREYAASTAPAGAGAEASRRKAWQAFCHALFCANEFLYVD